MVKKYKKHIVIFLLSFIVYFILGMIISYHLGTTDTWNVMFDFDTPRVVGDLSNFLYDHHRVSVHPLFVIFFQPMILLLNLFINEKIISIIFFQSIISSITTCLFYITINKLCKDKKLKLIYLVLFITSFPQLVYTISIETYIFSQFFLVLLWLFGINKCDKKFNYWDYIILVILGITSIGVTITNFIQFIIIVIFIFTLNEKNKHRILNSIFIILISLCFSIVLAEIQNIIWSSAPNFFTQLVKDLIYNTSEESYYISRGITINNFVNVLNSNYSQSYNLFNLIIINESTIMFDNSLISNIISSICGVIFLLLNIMFFMKNSKKLYNHKIYFALLSTYVFNFALHILYGNQISFLYICHYNFIILYLYIYLINNLFNIKLNNKRVLLIVGIIILLYLRSIILLFTKLFNIYTFNNSIKFFPVMIIIISIIILLYVVIKKSKVFYEKIFRVN